MIIVEFQSKTNPDWWHTVSADLEKKVAECDCPGYLRWHRCWHIDMVLDLLKPLGVKNKYE